MMQSWGNLSGASMDAFRFELHFFPELFISKVNLKSKPFFRALAEGW
ncbi:hypothetical protein FHS57_005767 [Runella defluvii]|uniref:Uncharacterized protein n=1 Tax=Runella defluvii TaxID=370973 RepID=A0A7W6ETH3_9BACT|nr:hypothetical protein [Runella defluvii]